MKKQKRHHDSRDASNSTSNSGDVGISRDTRNSRNSRNSTSTATAGIPTGTLAREGALAQIGKLETEQAGQQQQTCQ